MPTVLRIDPLRAPACVNAVGTDSMGDQYKILQIGTNDSGIDYIVTKYTDGRQGYFYFNLEGHVWENRGGQDGRYGGRLVFCGDPLPPVPLTYLQRCSAGSIKGITHRYSSPFAGLRAQQQRYRQAEAEPMKVHLVNLDQAAVPCTEQGSTLCVENAIAAVNDTQAAQSVAVSESAGHTAYAVITVFAPTASSTRQCIRKLQTVAAAVPHAQRIQPEDNIVAAARLAVSRTGPSSQAVEAAVQTAPVKNGCASGELTMQLASYGDGQPARCHEQQDDVQKDDEPEQTGSRFSRLYKSILEGLSSTYCFATRGQLHHQVLSLPAYKMPRALAILGKISEGTLQEHADRDADIRTQLVQIVSDMPAGKVPRALGIIRYLAGHGQTVEVCDI